MAQTGDPGVEDANLAEMREYLAQTEVIFAILFGSYARDAADRTSDIDIALCFPDGIERQDRFRLRNRIDAELQQYAEEFVDVSDIDALPTPVAYAALREGIILVGDENIVKAVQSEIEQKYEATADDRKQERRDFIQQLAEGDV